MRSNVNKNVFKYCVLYTHPQAFMCLLQFKYDKSCIKLNTPTAYITYNLLHPTLIGLILTQEMVELFDLTITISQ